MITVINNREFHIKDPTVLTIGKFDGVHLGHQALIEELISEGKKNDLKTVVFTFNTLPETLLNNISENRICSNQDRNSKLESEGIDYLIEYPFDMELARTDAAEFINDILIGKCNMKMLIGGEDISFGHNKSGNINTLPYLSEKYGFNYRLIEKIKSEKGIVISSELIRGLIKNGEITEANRLLNRS